MVLALTRGRTARSPPDVLMALALSGALSGPAAAQVAPILQDPAERLLREQRERERDERLQQAPPPIAVPPAPALDPDASPEAIADPEPTFLIDRIEVSGNTVIPAREVDGVTAPFAGKRLGVNRINLLLQRLTQAFVDRGYITTRAYVGNQSLASGTLEITVVPGRIETLRYNGNDLAPGEGNDTGVRMAFPTGEGDVLRLRDLEQGVEQINRMRRNRAELQILPGQTPGGSVVDVRNRPGDRFFYAFGVDNFGTEPTGQNRLRAGIEADDLIGAQEVMSASYVGSRDSNALLFAGSVPWGYSTFSYSYAWSEFQNVVGNAALFYGSTRLNSFAWNRVIGLSARGKSSLDLSLSLIATQREINNIDLVGQDLTVVRAAYNRLQRFPVGQRAGAWTIDLGYSRGLTAFGATRDPAGLPEGAPNAQFGRIDGSGSLFVPFTSSIAYRGIVSGQVTREGLYSSQQLFIGGVNTVRGYAEATLVGDRGFFNRNELAYTRVVEVFGVAVRLEPYAFFDGGGTELVATGKWRALTGTGAGLRFGGRLATAEVVFAQPLAYPAELPGVKFRVYATFNIVL